MKKSFILAALMVVFGATMAYAQPRAIGANLGGGIGFSYQHGFGASNMLDVAVDVPIAVPGFGLGGTVTYDWIDPFGTSVPWNEKGEWHWYMGVGGATGLYGFNSPVWYLGAAGHFGIEYDFWFPLQLSLDWRPNIGFVCAKDYADFNKWGFYGISLGVRYKF